MQQTTNGLPTTYTLDINTALPQVLQDGTNTYIYGVDRISQVSGANTDYFLGDALGSRRQLVHNSSQITITESYDPFGNLQGSMGTDNSVFSYTGEQADPNGLTYLRARY